MSRTLFNFTPQQYEQSLRRQGLKVCTRVFFRENSGEACPIGALIVPFLNAQNRNWTITAILKSLGFEDADKAHEFGAGFDSCMEIGRTPEELAKESDHFRYGWSVGKHIKETLAADAPTAARTEKPRLLL